VLCRENLAKLKEAEISTCDADALIDLKNIKIDIQKTIEERAESFIEQVHNPYIFKIGDIIVKVDYGSGKDFSEILTDVILAG